MKAINKQKGYITSQTILQTVSTARTLAAQKRTLITVCPTDNKTSCSSSGRYILTKSTDEVLACQPLSFNTTYRGFPQYQYPTYEPSGYSKTNGRFVTNHYAVILAYGGHPRIETRSS
ncbi:MAG: hypothetical protein CMF48_01455 [Legionellales bacterium]|nr:hypothetical protein [Legionellales bacterium]